ncbi:hypothetical protein LLS1_35340 [Leifsonia sp. LS1]|uniref:hypothetical protein n=1 Tax=Leifsonia sp. LS1 TaxID=2828483 RepID=UPI001CFC84BC|nr:hypothetical protein [Leifsonia sp. LS1]GIT81865.1 hypothetical protein LLS1_35340 [Leifsonia sp. LS1]
MKWSELVPRVPGFPAAPWTRAYGVRFPGRDKDGGPFGPPDVERVDIPAGAELDMDLLVIMPYEFDDPYETIVVILNERCRRKPRLLRELQRLTPASPDRPDLRVYMPEQAPGDPELSRGLQDVVDAAGIPAEISPYYP